MGMASSDDEAKIMEDHALLEWARQAPQPSWDYDRGPTEDERDAHDRAVRDHHSRRPNTRNPYENDRR